ncbi:MAG: serine/threonine-protein kinase, partial [Planctomycetota bacterium]
LSDYQEFLNALEQNFETLTKNLMQHQVPLRDYYHFLSEKDFSTSNGNASPETEVLEKLEILGNYLLENNKISLEELNELLKEIPQEKLLYQHFLRLLVLKRKFSTDDFIQFSEKIISVNPPTLCLLKWDNQKIEFRLKEAPPLKRMGEYELLEEIGRGGMGVVYKAYHRGLNQYIALKMMLSKINTNENALHRFQREMKILAKLDHPGIVKIFNSGEEDGVFYLVMEYVSGNSLERQREKLTQREKIEIINFVLKALAYAHQQNILHRDLKLENILLHGRNQPKIVDFGLAKSITEEQEDHKITQSGALLGTTSYMAPEQISGAYEKIGIQTDLYAMGICLYRLLSAKYPYEGKSIPDLFQQIMTQEPKSPRFWNPNIHKDLEAIILKAIAKNPKERYDNAESFGQDIQNFLEGHPVKAGAFSWSKQVKQWKLRYQYPFLCSSFVFMILFSLVLGFTYTQNYENRKNLEKDFQEAIQRYTQSQIKISIPHKTALLWSALTLINKVLLEKKEREIESFKWKIGEELLKLAYLSESYHWADYLVQELLLLKKISEEKRNQLKTQLESEKQKDFVRQDRLLENWKKRLQEQNVSPEESNDAS